MAQTLAPSSDVEMEDVSMAESSTTLSNPTTTTGALSTPIRPPSSAAHSVNLAFTPHSALSHQTTLLRVPENTPQSAASVQTPAPRVPQNTPQTTVQTPAFRVPQNTPQSTLHQMPPVFMSQDTPMAPTSAFTVPRSTPQSTASGQSPTPFAPSASHLSRVIAVLGSAKEKEPVATVLVKKLSQILSATKTEFRDISSIRSLIEQFMDESSFDVTGELDASPASAEVLEELKAAKLQNSKQHQIMETQCNSNLY
jgi:hypothetical protein